MDRHVCGFQCQYPYADCNGVASDGCEVDLYNDASNCGACGVHCAHGCVGGVCALRWDGESHVAGLTDGQPGSSLLQPSWTSWDGGTLDVRQGPADGGVPITLASVPAGAGAPAALSLAGSDIYFATGAAGSGAVYRLRPGAAAPELLASNQDGPGNLLVAASSVYWSNRFGGAVMRVRLDGGVPELVASGLPRPTQLAADESRVYWINEGFDGGDGSVMAAPLDGGPAAVVSTGDSGGAPAAMTTVATPDTPTSIGFHPHPVWADRRSRQIWTLRSDVPQSLLSPSTVPADWTPRQLFSGFEYFYLFDAAAPGLYVPDHIFVPGAGPGYEPPFSLIKTGNVGTGAIGLSSPSHTFWTDGSTIQQFQR